MLKQERSAGGVCPEDQVGEGDMTGVNTCLSKVCCPCPPFFYPVSHRLGCVTVRTQRTMRSTRCEEDRAPPLGMRECVVTAHTSRASCSRGFESATLSCLRQNRENPCQAVLSCARLMERAPMIALVWERTSASPCESGLFHRHLAPRVDPDEATYGGKRSCTVEVAGLSVW